MYSCLPTGPTSRSEQMPQIFCILDEGGRTLVTKATGDIQVPSFPTVGLLCSISTYGDSAGFSVETFRTTNVQIVYKRFPEHLLFVLATSNLLMHPQQLQTLLQVVYDGLVMLLGPIALQIDAPGRLEALRKKLRGLELLDSLIVDDALVPCVMLQAPQVLGMPTHELQTLEAALEKIAAAAGSGLAALITEGWYMAATPEWWMLQAREVLLLQHIASAASEVEDLISMDVYLSTNKLRTPLTLWRVTLDYGLYLLLVSDKAMDMDLVHPTIDQQASRVDPILQMPAWGMPPIPQYSTLSFDMCLVVQHSLNPRIILLWGHNREVPAGFNPLMSPTLKRQLASSTGGASNAAASSNMRSTSLSQRDVSSADNMQLYYHSCVDMLVSFMLQLQHPPGHGSSSSGSGAQVASPARGAGGSGRADPGGGGGGGGAASPGSQASMQQQRAGAPWRTSDPSRPGRAPEPSPSPSTEDEIHLVTAGNRLVALKDSTPHGIDVFAVFPRRCTRLEARDCAQKLRAIFQMTYNQG